MRAIVFERSVPRILLIKALRPLWPGVAFSSLSPTHLVEQPDPILPGPRWVRLRNRLCGICASDLHLIFAEVDPRMSLAALPSDGNNSLGHELIAEVAEVGAGVASLKAGDRVILDSGTGATCFSQEINPPCRRCREGNLLLCENAGLGLGPAGAGGGWGDSMVVHESGVYRVPAEIDDETAALIEPLSVGVRAARRRLPGPGEQALVVGSGTIGLAVIAAVHALSPRSRVTAMARYPQQVELAARLGAETVLRGGDPYAAVAELTGGKLYTGLFHNRTILGGFDVVYDCVGTARTLQDSLRWTRAGGTVVLTGVSLKPLDVDLTPVWHQEVELLGTFAHGMEEWNGVRQSTYDLTVELLRSGRINPAGLVTHRFPLEQWRTAVRTAADKSSGAIKVLLDCQSVTMPAGQ